MIYRVRNAVRVVMCQKKSIRWRCTSEAEGVLWCRVQTLRWVVLLTERWTPVRWIPPPNLQEVNQTSMNLRGGFHELNIKHQKMTHATWNHMYTQNIQNMLHWFQPRTQVQFQIPLSYLREKEPGYESMYTLVSCQAHLARKQEPNKWACVKLNCQITQINQYASQKYYINCKVN